MQLQGAARLGINSISIITKENELINIQTSAFPAGFVSGEGCFTIGIKKESKAILGETS